MRKRTGSISIAVTVEMALFFVITLQHICTLLKDAWSIPVYWVIKSSLTLIVQYSKLVIYHMALISFIPSIGNVHSSVTLGENNLLFVSCSVEEWGQATGQNGRHGVTVSNYSVLLQHPRIMQTGCSNMSVNLVQVNKLCVYVKNGTYCYFSDNFPLQARCKLASHFNHHHAQ